MLHFDIDEFRSIHLPTEQDIIDKWTGKHDKPLVSVICITYNQEKYIEDAIRGFLIQKTSFPFEIIIHDDASNDLTTFFIKKYAKKYPRIIKPIFQHENQYSKSPNLVLFGTFKAAKGDYFAICEGDDFWIDEYKLEIQVKSLLKNTNIKMSFHSAIRYNCVNNVLDTVGQYSKSNALINVEDVILKSKGMIPTASTMISSCVAGDFIRIMSELDAKVGDIYIHIISSLPGGAIFINKTMSVYRFFSENSFNNNVCKNSKSLYESYINRIYCFNRLSLIYTQYKNVFDKANQNVTVYFLRNNEVDLEYRKKAYNLNKVYLHITYRLMSRFIMASPVILDLYRQTSRLIKKIT